MHGGNLMADAHGVGELHCSSQPATNTVVELFGSSRRLRVLVVEDDVPSLQLLAKLFKMTGHDVRRAIDGLEALEVAAVFKPELVLLNIGMPKLDGYATCRRMRQEPWGQAMVIVAVTGYIDDGSSRKAGFNLHLVKPVDPQILFKIAAEVPTPG